MLKNGSKIFITLKIFGGQIILLSIVTNTVLCIFTFSLMPFFQFSILSTDKDFLRPATQNSNSKKISIVGFDRTFYISHNNQ